MSKHLRSYLKELYSKFPSSIQVINNEVDPRFGITGYAAAYGKRGEYPGLLFNDVKGAEFACLSNLMTTNERMALFLNCKVEDIPKVFGEKIRKQIAPTEVTEKEAPVKEVILKGDEVDLTKLPIPVHNEMDGGPYLSAGVMVIRDPEDGEINAGIYRHQVYGKQELGVWFLGAHHGGLIHQKYKNAGKPAPVAIVLGHHPGFLMGAVARIPGIGGEYEVAGSLMGESLNVVKAETSDLLVPSDAEIILEGEILPDVQAEEGPFGEWPGHYLGGGTGPVIRITCISHRKNAIFQDIVASSREHLMVGAIPRSGSIYRNVKAVVPNIKTVHVPSYARMHCYLSIDKQRDADVKKAAFAVLNTEQENLRHIVVVDEDIDVFNEQEVAWAIGTRFDAKRDQLIIPEWNGPGGLLPTNWDYHEDGSHTARMSSAVIIDATKPAPPIPYPKRAIVPKEHIDKADTASSRELNDEEKQKWFK